MSNEKFQADLSAHLDAELPPDRARSLEKHVERNKQAKREQEELTRVVKQVRDLPRTAPPPDFVSQVMDKVIEVSAARGARAMRPGRRKKRRSGSPEDPFANDPFEQEPELVDSAEGASKGFGPDPVCAPYVADLSASLDDELSNEGLDRLYNHLKDCASCRNEQRVLYDVMDLVQALPRILVPLAFKPKIMAHIDAERLEATRESLRERQERHLWWARLGHVAQAACFLIVVIGGVALTTPREQSLATLSRQPFSSRADTAGSGKLSFTEQKRRKRTKIPRARPAKQAPTRKASMADLPRGKYDASWELLVSSLPEASETTRQLLNRYGSVEREVRGDKDTGYTVNVPANRIDDLHRGLDRAATVETNRASAESLPRIHTEHDQVVLTNGFVLVGRAQRRNGTILLKVGDSVHTIDVADVRQLEQAEAQRRLRIVLHKRD